MIKASIGEPPIAISPKPEQIYCKAIKGNLPRASCELRKQSYCKEGCEDQPQKRDYQLTQLQKAILELIKKRPNASNAEIAEEIGCNQSTVYTTRLRKG